MDTKIYQVLFVCTGNSARSILAEAMMTHLGVGRFNAHSAGSHPSGVVHPLALATLRQLRIPAEGLRSKAWDEFALPGAPALDFVLTVCDNAAGEVCPVWPGQPMTARWGMPDPAAVQGSDEQKARAFMDTAILLQRRIQLMLALPVDKLAGMSLQDEMNRIGTTKA